MSTGSSATSRGRAIGLGLAVAVGALALIAACAPSPWRTRELVEQYLASVAGAADDRGWSLLHPHTRRTHFQASISLYLEAVRTSEWDSFEWAIEDVVADDASLHFARVRMVSRGDFPALLARSGPDCPGIGDAMPPGDIALLWVRYREGTGIWAPGGSPPDPACRVRG